MTDTAPDSEFGPETGPEAGAPAELGQSSAGGWARFTAWRRQRPFVGGLLTVLAGLEMFFSGQLDFGKIHVQLGIEGLQATIIPVLLVLLGVLAIAMPVHRIFYGVLALAVAVYSLIGVNLGGFFIGMLLGAVGGIFTVAWMPKGSLTRRHS
ncbi:MAG TPA: DUF6114 domain-containing protein [Leifsonia sp.]|jgi:hypothetical protein|nr:DUF6114 domain-containing protein [Leifsonia sp.]